MVKIANNIINTHVTDDVQLEINSELKNLELLLSQYINENSAEFLHEIADYIISAGGKRIRPMLLIILAKLLGYQGQKHIKLAAVIELIHTATLLHDDIIDDSFIRRNKPSAHIKWDIRTSLITGDWLFAKAFKLSTSCEQMELTNIICRMTKIMSQGELQQLDFKGKTDLTEQDYYSIIKAKTGLLFEAACELAAVVAHQPADIVTHTKKFGLNLGIAFQIKDDLLDYSGSIELLGKNIGDDLNEGKMTLPLIYLKNRAPTEFKKIIKEIRKFDNNTNDFYVEFQQLQKLLEQHHCLQDTHNSAMNYLDIAKKHLFALPSNIYRDYLVEYMHKAVSRES